MPLIIITFVMGFVGGICSTPQQIAQQLSNSVSRGDADESILVVAIILILVGIVTSIIGTAITRFLECGYMRICHLAASGQQYDSMEVVKGASNGWLKYWGIMILYTLAIAISFFFFILPFFYLAVKLMFVRMLAANHRHASLNAIFRRSWQMTDGYFGQLFVLGIVASVISFVGLLLCCIGAFPAGVLGNLMLAEIYETLGGAELLEGEENTEDAISYE